MLKYLYASMIFFAFELLLCIHYHQNILSGISNVDKKYIGFRKSQKDIFSIVETIKKHNKTQQPAIFAMGGSTGMRFFFGVEESDLQKATAPLPIYNFCIGTQNLFDEVRMIDNINVPGSIVVLVLFPYKFSSELSRQDLLMCRYETGVIAKYLMESEFSEKLFDELEIKEERVVSKLAPDLNTYAHLLNNLFADRYRDLIKFNFKSIIFYEENTPSDKPLSKRIERIEKLAQVGKNYQQAMPFNFRILSKMHQLCEAKKINFCFIDLPYTKLYEERCKHVIDEYQMHMDEFKKQHPEISHFQWKQPAIEEQKYFSDGYHVNAVGREFFKEYQQQALRYFIENRKYK